MFTKNILVFDSIVRKILAECKKQKKVSATLTLEEVGKFDNCTIELKIIPKGE